MNYFSAGFVKGSASRPKHNNTKRVFVFVLPVALAWSAIGQTDRDKSIKEKLAAPPVSLDEQHQGPTLVPRDLPEQVLPFDCRATQAYVHRLRPGQYHFERAQRLLGLGIDVIGCEAFGLERFSKQEDGRVSADQAVKEAEAAAALPIGLEQWRPGALHYILTSAYRNAADAHRGYARKHNSKADSLTARHFDEQLRKIGALEDEAVSPSSMRRTPLIEAVLRNDQQQVTELLEAGTDPNAGDVDHITGLRVAVVTGRLELVQVLLDHGAKPDVLDEEDATALMDACAIGRLSIAKVLLAHDANPNAMALDGSTPLLESIGRPALPRNWESRREMVNVLLNNKASVNVADWQGITPMLAAARTGDAEGRTDCGRTGGGAQGGAGTTGSRRGLAEGVHDAPLVER